MPERNHSGNPYQVPVQLRTNAPKKTEAQQRTRQQTTRQLHIASGRRLTADTMPTLVEAALWLRSLTDVTGWTQPVALLQGREDLRNHVHAAQKQAFRKYASMIGDKHEGMDQA